MVTKRCSTRLVNAMGSSDRTAVRQLVKLCSICSTPSSSCPASSCRTAAELELQQVCANEAERKKLIASLAGWLAGCGWLAVAGSSVPHPPREVESSSTPSRTAAWLSTRNHITSRTPTHTCARPPHCHSIACPQPWFKKKRNPSQLYAKADF